MPSYLVPGTGTTGAPTTPAYVIDGPLPASLPNAVQFSSLYASNGFDPVATTQTIDGATVTLDLQTIANRHDGIIYISCLTADNLNLVAPIILFSVANVAGTLLIAQQVPTYSLTGPDSGIIVGAIDLLLGDSGSGLLTLSVTGVPGYTLNWRAFVGAT